MTTNLLRKSYAMLRKLEWCSLEIDQDRQGDTLNGVPMRYQIPCCPVCLEPMKKDDHAPDCELDALLKELEETL